MELDPSLIAAVKTFEGFTPKAQWDYKQHTNGYGTKAAYPGEVIDEPTANQRLLSELGPAQAKVQGFAPQAPPGWQKALASLTMNAGPGWMNAGLGSAVKAGDWNKAQELFGQYNKAGGQELPGLTARRQQELSLFTQSGQQAQGPAPFQAIPPAAAPSGVGLFGAPPGGVSGAPPPSSGAPVAPQSNPLSSFFASLPAQGPAPAPMPMFQPPQRPQVDMTALQQFLASQQIGQS